MKYFWVLIFTVYGASSGVAQTPDERYLREAIEQRSFDEPSWNELTQDLDYSPFGKKPKTKEEAADSDPRQNEEAGGRRRLAVRADHPLLANIVKFFIILTTAIGLAVLLKHLLGFGLFPRNKRIDARAMDEAQLEQIEENLYASDLETFIRQAIERQQYAVAVRLYFLAILKELSLQKAIRWKKDKTNREYLRELQNGEDFDDFRQTTLIFERVWYGDRMIDGTGFARIEGRLAAFLRRLQQRAG